MGVDEVHTTEPDTRFLPGARPFELIAHRSHATWPYGVSSNNTPSLFAPPYDAVPYKFPSVFSTRAPRGWAPFESTNRVAKLSGHGAELEGVSLKIVPQPYSHLLAVPPP